MQHSAIGYGDEAKQCQNCGATRLMYEHENGAYDQYVCATCECKFLHRDGNNSGRYWFELKPLVDSRLQSLLEQDHSMDESHEHQTTNSLAENTA